MKQAAIHGLVLTLTLVLAGCGDKKTGDGKNGDGGVKIDHSSPEKVAESFKKAMSEKDWTTGMACMTEESQEGLAGMLALVAGFSVAFGMDEAKKKSLEDLFEKHGMDKDAKEKDGLKDVKDKGALVADLIDWLEKNAPSKKKGKGPASLADDIANTEFSNFKEDGDTATADLVDADKKKDTGYFKKIDGKWYVDFAESMKQKKKGAKPFPK